MPERPALSRPRAAIAAATAALTIGGVGLAWTNVSSPPAPSSAAGALTASTEAPGEVSGPCDEAEHAGDPRCAGAPGGATSTSTSTTTSTTVATAGTPTTPVAVGAPAAAGNAAPAAPQAADVRSFDAADAGTVTYQVSGDQLTLLDATPAAGWRVEVEQGQGREIDLDFRSGLQRVQVDVELEDGGVRERVRSRDDADDTRTETVDGAVTEPEPGDDHGGHRDGDG